MTIDTKEEQKGPHMTVDTREKLKGYILPFVIAVFCIKPATQEILPVLLNTMHNIYLSSKSKDSHIGLTNYSLEKNVSGDSVDNGEFSLTIFINKIGRPQRVKISSPTTNSIWLSNDELMPKVNNNGSFVSHKVINGETLVVLRPKNSKLKIVEYEDKKKKIKDLVIYTKGEFYLKQGQSVIGFGVLVFLGTLIFLTKNIIKVVDDEKNDNIYFKLL